MGKHEFVRAARVKEMEWKKGDLRPAESRAGNFGYQGSSRDGRLWLHTGCQLIQVAGATVCTKEMEQDIYKKCYK